MLWLSMSTSPMTLTLDFQGQILKMLYFRNWRANWHWTNKMWVNMMLHPLCDFQLRPQPWPWLEFSKSNFEKVSGMGWPIHMEPKGCESIECWTHVVTFNITLTRALRVKIWKCCISGMTRPIDIEQKGCKSIGYRNWYQDWGHCGVTNDLGSSPQPEGETRGLWWASQVVGDTTMTEIEVSISILSWCRIGD